MGHCRNRPPKRYAGHQHNDVLLIETDPHPEQRSDGEKTL